MAEQDRRPALVLTDLYRLCDAAVGDALEHLILTSGRPFDGPPPVFTRVLLGEVDPHPAALVDEAAPLSEPVLPHGAGVQQRWLKRPVVTKAQMRSRGADSHLLEQARQDVAREGRCEALVFVVRRLRKKVPPHPRQADRGLVPPVDALSLNIVEVSPQTGIGQEDRRLDPRHPHSAHAQLVGSPREPALEVFGLGVGEVQGVAQCATAGAVVLTEGPRVPMVDNRSRMGLQL